jgi:hypothetical protein
LIGNFDASKNSPAIDLTHWERDLEHLARHIGLAGGDRPRIHPFDPDVAALVSRIALATRHPPSAIRREVVEYLEAILVD